ncbi:MAG: hypothetical protein QM811_25660 [Pirellulales bacterium]
MTGLQRFLKDAKPQIAKVDLMRQLLSMVLPSSIRLIVKNFTDLQGTTNVTLGIPQSYDRKFLFYCRDFANGKVLRAEINSDHILTYEIVGECEQLEML